MGSKMKFQNMNSLCHNNTCSKIPQNVGPNVNLHCFAISPNKLTRY